MVNYERVAEKIFSIIKGHGHNLSMYKEDGMDTTDAAEARRFFVAQPNYMITLDEETNTIKINKNSNLSLEDLEGIMKQMKNLARENMLNTQVKVFGKEITPKDFAYQAKKFKDSNMNEDHIAEASLSRMSGSKKTSYQTLESVKMIVRHRKAVDENVRGSRSRQISAIFLEQAGERFRFPHNHLMGARAMARHMYEGGNMQDTIGEYIIESVGNVIKLVEFVRYARTNKLMNEANDDVVKVVKENIATIRSELKGLTGTKSYASVSEAIAAREASVLEEDDTTDLEDMFTVRKFDEKIGDMLPLVRRLMNEKQAWRNALLEASQQTIYMHAKEELAEEDIMEFDSPIQQVGYKINKIAKRMIESGDLSNFVSKVASKLIEGQKISDFEKTVVRNVMENAKITESSKCDKCGCYDCTCEANKNTVESITDQYELKMKMIEHEEIFEDYEKCDRCRKGTMHKGDTMMGPAKECDRCGYQQQIDEADVGMTSDDEWNAEVHRGESEAGAHMGMPPEDSEGMHIDSVECDDCEGSGIGLDGISDCYACNGTGNGEEINSNEFDGQPSEYDEWQDYYGGDDYAAQYDESIQEAYADESDECNRCNGLGRHPSRSSEDCPECHGSGKCPLTENTCKHCNGDGVDDEDDMGLCSYCDGSGKTPLPKKYSSS